MSGWIPRAAGDHVDDQPLLDAWQDRPPAPARDDAYHGIAGEWVAACAAHSEADPHGILAAYLTMAGSAINSGPHQIVGGTRHACNLYACLVGATATGRKGTATDMVRPVFQAADGDWLRDRMLSGLSSGEGVIHHVRDQRSEQEPIRGKDRAITGYRPVVVDHGVSDKRLLAVETELGGTFRVMARDGNTLAQVLRLAWDGGTLRTLTKHSPAVATGAHVSILGNITVAEAREVITSREIASGSANRFLWVYVTRSRLLPSGGDLASVDLTPHARALQAALDHGRRCGRLRRTASAERLWADHYERLTSLPDTLTGAILARGAAQVLRLSAIYTLLDQANRIDNPHLQAALALWDYCADSTRCIFGDATGHQLADELLGELRRRADGLTRAEIYDVLGRNTRRPIVHAALETLDRHRLATMTREASGPQGGRPVERWRATRATITGHEVSTDNTAPRVFTDNTRARESQPSTRHRVFTDNTVSRDTEQTERKPESSRASENGENHPGHRRSQTPPPPRSAAGADDAREPADLAARVGNGQDVTLTAAARGVDDPAENERDVLELVDGWVADGVATWEDT